MPQMPACVSFVARVRRDGRNPGVSYELRTCVWKRRKHLRQRVPAVCGKTVSHVHIHTDRWSTYLFMK